MTDKERIEKFIKLRIEGWSNYAALGAIRMSPGKFFKVANQEALDQYEAWNAYYLKKRSKTFYQDIKVYGPNVEKGVDVVENINNLHVWAY
jgi:hypothetical protein